MVSQYWKGTPNLTEKAGKKRKPTKGTVGIMVGLTAVAVCFLLLPDPVYAADAAGGAENVSKAIEKIKTLMTTVVSGIGAVITVKSIMDFSTAYSSQDNTGMNTALRGIVGGLIMALGSGILTWLGLS